MLEDGVGKRNRNHNQNCVGSPSQHTPRSAYQYFLVAGKREEHADDVEGRFRRQAYNTTGRKPPNASAVSEVHGVAISPNDRSAACDQRNQHEPLLPASKIDQAQLRNPEMLI